MIRRREDKEARCIVGIRPTVCASDNLRKNWDILIRLSARFLCHHEKVGIAGARKRVTAMPTICY